MAMKVILLAVFFSVMLAVGVLCRRRATNVHGFVLGGRSVGPWLTAFAYGTSYFSAVIFVGYAGQFGWKFGIASTWIGLGNALIGSLLAWVLLGRRTRIMTQHLQSQTMPDFFAKRYDSRALRLFSSLIIFVFLIPYTASLYNGLSRLFGMAFEVDYTVCILVMALLTAVYVIAGGYMATAINDFIQGVIMLFGIVVIIAGVLKLNGGFESSLAALARVSDEPASDVPGVFASFFGADPAGLAGVILLTSLGTWGLPQMVQKFYAIKNENDVHKGTIISTLFAVVVAGGCYFLGGFARLFPVNVAEEGYDAIIPGMLSRLKPLPVAIALVLVLSASMSTLSSLVLTSSSSLTLDFIDPVIFRGERNDRRNLRLIRVFIAVFILISAVIAVIQYKKNLTFIAQLMGLSWGALAGSFLAPFLYSLFWKRATKTACAVSFAWGSLLMLCNLLFRSAFPPLLQSPINCGAFAMVGGLVLFPIVSLLSPGPDPAMTDRVFSCYEETVTVPVTEALNVVPRAKKSPRP